MNRVTDEAQLFLKSRQRGLIEQLVSMLDSGRIASLEVAAGDHERASGLRESLDRAADPRGGQSGGFDELNERHAGPAGRAFGVLVVHWPRAK